MLQPLTEPLVLAVLEKLKLGTSPGADGLPAEVFMALVEECLWPMIWAVQCYLEKVECSLEWVVSLQQNIPKTDPLADLRPITLQQMKFQLPATVVFLQVQDALQPILPFAQQGFMKGRCVLGHIERARLTWES